MELAAARARTLSVPAIRDGMADRLRFLAARDPRSATPYRSLRASLDRSVELAGGAARHALAALSVVDGASSLDVALALTGDRDAVETLVEHSLVQFDALDHRYLLLDTVRDYAAADLAAAGAAALAHNRLIDWAVAFAAGIRAGLERADPGALRRADACDAAVTSALQHAVAAGRGADGAAVAADLAFAWSLRGRCTKGIAQVRRLEAALDPVPPPLRWAHAFLAAYSGEMESGARRAHRGRLVPGRGAADARLHPPAARRPACRAGGRRRRGDRRWSGSAIRSSGRGTRRSAPRSRAGRAGSRWALMRDDFVNTNDIGAGPWRENRGREAMMRFWGEWMELFDNTFRQEILDDQPVLVRGHRAARRRRWLIASRISARVAALRNRTGCDADPVTAATAASPASRHLDRPPGRSDTPGGVDE